MSTSRNTVKKEFDAFASKIARLESLRQQLVMLDTRGFENEAKLILARLNDVNALPAVEKDFDALKRKIVARPQHSQPHAAVSSARVSHLSEEVHAETSAMKRRIGELEREIEKKRHVSGKKQLSHKDVDYVKDIPKLEHELRALRGQLDQHLASKKVHIDSGVGVIVDSKFDDFISSIKGELSERLKEREQEMSGELKADLQQQEHIFAQRYRALVEEFHERYKKKVREELHAEVQSKFNEELASRLADERHALVGKLVAQNSARLAKERRDLVAKLHAEHMAKEKAFMAALAKKRAAALQTLRVAHASLLAKRKAMDARTRELADVKAHTLKSHDEEMARLERAHQKERAALQARMKLVAKQRGQLRARNAKILAREERALAARLRAEEQKVQARYAAIASLKREINASLAEGRTHLLALRNHDAALVHKKEAHLVALRNRDAALLKKQEARVVALRREQEVLLKKKEVALAAIHEGHEKTLAKKRAELESIRVAHERELQKKHQELVLSERTYQERLARQRAGLVRARAALANRFAKQRSALSQEHARLKEQQTALRRRESELRAELKRVFDKQLAAHVSENDASFRAKVEALKKRVHHSLEDRTREMQSRYESQMKEELTRKEKVLRAQLKTEYDGKLRSTLAQKDAEFAKKKALLEQHVMNHLKKVLV